VDEVEAARFPRLRAVSERIANMSLEASTHGYGDLTFAWETAARRGIRPRKGGGPPDGA
jgi:hypothetical protein